MELPTKANLPAYVIAILLSICGGLVTSIIKRESECAEERRVDKADYEKRLAEIYNQARQDAKEASSRFERYQLRQDSINRAQINALEKVRRR